MYGKLTMTLAAGAALLLAACAAAADGMDNQTARSNAALDDLEIAHAAYTAGAVDIRYAHLALAISDDDAVRAFARSMLRDHSAVNDAATGLTETLQVTPRDNELSRQLAAGAAAKRAELRGLSSAAFDCAYAENELAYHRLVNRTVEDSFIPNATVPELKALLTEALLTFKAHEAHAARMVAGLGCG